MGIGILEIALLFIVTACVVVAVVMTRRRWLLGLPVYFVIATLCSVPSAVHGAQFTSPTLTIREER